MNEMTTEEVVKAAREKMLEALKEYVDAVADEGEPEAIESAVLLFESRGMADSGIFSRISFVLVEQSNLTQMVGMVDVAGNKALAMLRSHASGEIE